MHLIRLAACTLGITLICAGCATTSSTSKQTSEETATDEVIQQRSQPEWVTGESKDYPHLNYMTTRTTADSKEIAERLAIEKLSSLFAVDIKKYDMSQEQASKAANHELVEPLSNDKQHWVASTDASRIFNAIKLVDQWHDIATGKHHALAIITRSTGEGYLRQQIKTLDKLTEDYVQQARTITDPLTQIGFIAGAWRSQQIRSELQSSMRVADLTARGIQPSWNVDQLKKECLGLLTKLKIYPTGLSDEMNAQLVTNILSGGLKIADLTPANEADADYVLRATLEATIAGAQGRWALGHGIIKLVLADSATGKLRGSKQLEIETPGLDENAALRRVAEKTEYLMKKEMRNLLIDLAM